MSDLLAPIRQKFRQRCAGDLDRVRAVLADPPPVTDGDFHKMIHQLVGMSGSVGFVDLSDQAAELDDLLARGAPPDLAKLRALEVSLAEVVAGGEAG